MEASRTQDIPIPASDKELAVRIGHGDRGAFEVMMRQHNRRLYRVARAILNDDADAEEALQDSYLIAYRHVAGFEGKSKLSTWLTRIVINEALQRRRKNKRHRDVIPFASFDSEEAMTTAAETKPETPEQASMRSEMQRLLEHEVGNLPVAFRTVFILREVEDMTMEEIAECLDLPAATVRTRLFRAKSQLRESLAKEFDVAMEGAFDFAGERCERIVARVLAYIATLPGKVET